MNLVFIPMKGDGCASLTLRRECNMMTLMCRCERFDVEGVNK